MQALRADHDEALIERQGERSGPRRQSLQFGEHPRAQPLVGARCARRARERVGAFEILRDAPAAAAHAFTCSRKLAKRIARYGPPSAVAEYPARCTFHPASSTSGPTVFRHRHKRPRTTVPSMVRSR